MSVRDYDRCWSLTRGRVATLAVTVLGLLVSINGSAEARTSASRAEQISLAEDLGLDIGCFDAFVSDVDAPAEWAAVRLTNEDDCPMGDGVALLSRGPAEPDWRTAYEGPSDPVPCLVDRPTGVPVPVAIDLRVCRRAGPTGRTLIIDGGRMKYKPRSIFQGTRGVYKIRWSSWRDSSAAGRGRFEYRDAFEPFTVAVRWRLSRPRDCEDGTRIFTRRTVTAVRTRDRDRIRFDTRYRALPRCDDVTR